MKKFDSKEIAWCVSLWIVFTLGLLGLLLSASRANAQTWDWSPPAPHHAAVCRVNGRNGDGSGIYVQHGELRGVLTAAHVTEGRNAIVYFSDGTKATGKSTTDKFNHDVAFVFVTHPTITPIAMANIDPQLGDRVEFLTTGGPEHRPRMFWATIRAIGDSVTEYDCDVLAGDSGGAILNTQLQLVGIQSFGRFPLTAWPAYRGSGSASCKPIRDFLGRVAKCEPKGCPIPDDNAQFYPPRNPKLVPVQKPDRRPFARGSTPEDLTPDTPPGPFIDYKKLVKMILAKIDPEDFRGPVGPPGSRGLQGADGPTGQQGPRGAAGDIDLDDLAKRIKKRISGSIRVKVRPVVKP